MLYIDDELVVSSNGIYLFNDLTKIITSGMLEYVESAHRKDDVIFLSDEKYFPFAKVGIALRIMDNDDLSVSFCTTCCEPRLS